ncbi:YodC family protein [Hyphomicrobium nitrativorans]|uniref:YodC family protein n=1 Tax=Hyphomicrobium nitrativorans TaxID=1427356 RepID=UPI0009E071C5|nr:DUF2158 domain-containing protein [Hyphomicrobium nitrativorans]
MPKNIAVGDVVQLKSGGPPMTVGKIECPTTSHNEDTALCAWIGENGQGETYTFPVVCLRKY